MKATHQHKGIRIAIIVLLMIVLAVNVMAETKPVRGYLQKDGKALTEESVFVVVEVYGNTEYPCYCNTYEVFSSSIGEFVSDLGNLYYMEECSFWKKKQGDPCYNDWKEKDKILVKANGELKEAKQIGTESIEEIGNLVYESEKIETTTKTQSLQSIRDEISSEYKKYEPKEQKPIIEDLRIEMEEGSYYLVGKVLNPEQEKFESLTLEIITKDVHGQIYEQIKSEKFSLESEEVKEIKLEWDIRSNAGIYLISSLLYEGEEVVSVSEELQVVIDKENPKKQYYIMERNPTNLVGSSNNGLWPILLLIIGLLVVILLFQVKIVKNQEKKEKIKKAIKEHKKEIFMMSIFLFLAIFFSMFPYGPTGFVIVDDATTIQGWVKDGANNPVDGASVYIYANVRVVPSVIECLCRSQSVQTTSSTGEYVDFASNLKIHQACALGGVGNDCPALDSDRDLMWVSVDGTTASPPTSSGNTTEMNITQLPHNPSWSIIWINSTLQSDTTPPNVTLVHPANNTEWNTTRTVTLTYNVTDESSINNCELIINGTINLTDNSIQKDINQTFDLSLANSTYSWIVNCTDANGEEGESEERILRVNVPNFPPVFTINVNDNSNAANPTNNDSSVTFTATATDSDGDQWYLVICGSEGINPQGTCSGSLICNDTTMRNSGQQSTCSHPVTGENSETYFWWGYACDGKKCSSYNNVTSPYNVNHPPTITSPTISGTYNTNSIITCTSGTSGDQDLVDSPTVYKYKWYINGTEEAGQTSATLNCGTVAKCGKTANISCANNAIDTHGYEGIYSGNSNNMTILNSPPTITGDLTPNSPVTDNNLLCSVTSSNDPDGDTLNYFYKWYNGSNLFLTVGPVSSASNTLSFSNTNPGNIWKCNITATDGEENSTETTDSVTIVTNNLPTTPVVNVTPENPTTINDLLCDITIPSTDADNDSISYYFSWYNDLVWVMTYGPTTSTTHLLESENTTKHENWKCTVTPYDGIGNGTVGTDNVTVLNTPPVSINIPDQSWLVNTNNTNAFDLDDYFSDVDEDVLIYICINVTNITTQIEMNGSVNFIPNTNFTGTRNTLCSANDSDNITESNNFTLNVYNCGDSICDATESCSTCPTDCGTCPVPPTPSSCFPAGTKIMMANGSNKKIEEVQVGDYVISYDEQTEKNFLNKVLELENPVRNHMCKISFADESKIKLTNEHPIYTTQGWKSINPKETYKENKDLAVETLKQGDEVRTTDSTYKKIKEINCWPEIIQTYNLKSVDKLNNFYAENVLVHNKGGGCNTRWDCSEWGPCIDGIEKRNCTYKGSCSSTGKKPIEEQECPIEIEIEKIKDIELTLITYPKKIKLTDEEFIVFAEVKNTGELLLEEVILNVKEEDGWNVETTHLGNIEVGEKKLVEIIFENKVCSSDYFVVESLLELRLDAIEKDVKDSENASIEVEIPKLSVLTDRKTYSEGDLMRTCIIYNNIAEENKEKLEFELKVHEDNSSYIIDYLSPYSVEKDRILFIIRDYSIDHIPITEEYDVNVKAYLEGSLFSEGYNEAEAGTSVNLNGFIENKVSQKENTIYEFRYDSEVHTISIEKIDKNFIEITVASNPKEYKIKLLETEYMDLDEDGIDDISITYLGQRKNNCDLRIRVLPKLPDKYIEGTESFELRLGQKSPALKQPTQFNNKAVYEVGSTFFVSALFKFGMLLLFLTAIIVVVELKVFVGTQDKFMKFLRKTKVETKKFLNDKLIKRVKKR